MSSMERAPVVSAPAARTSLRGSQLEEQAMSQPLTAPLSAQVLRSLNGLKYQIVNNRPIALADANAIERIFYAYVREQRAAREAARTAQQTAANISATQTRPVVSNPATPGGRSLGQQPTLPVPNVGSGTVRERIPR